MPREEVKDAAGLSGLSRKRVLCLLQGQDEKEGQNDDEECHGRSLFLLPPGVLVFLGSSYICAYCFTHYVHQREHHCRACVQSNFSGFPETYQRGANVSQHCQACGRDILETSVLPLTKPNHLLVNLLMT